MGETLTPNSQKGQRKQTGKSTYHKKYNTNIQIMPLIDAKSPLLRHFDQPIVNNLCSGAKLMGLIIDKSIALTRNPNYPSILSICLKYHSLSHAQEWGTTMYRCACTKDYKSHRQIVRLTIDYVQQQKVLR